MNTLTIGREIMNFQNKHFLFDFDGVISQSSYTLFEASGFALIHFDANIYRSLEERIEIQEKMKNVFENLIVTFDNMDIEI